FFVVQVEIEVEFLEVEFLEVEFEIEVQVEILFVVGVVFHVLVIVVETEFDVLVIGFVVVIDFGQE
ncbi:hypothetical protein A2U01_0068266, partial [Trifolium medium]|nr:hypothetical protein [Trifolium medium]